MPRRNPASARLVAIAAADAYERGRHSGKFTRVEGRRLNDYATMNGSDWFGIKSSLTLKRKTILDA